MRYPKRIERLNRTPMTWQDYTFWIAITLSMVVGLVIMWGNYHVTLPPA